MTCYFPSGLKFLHFRSHSWNFSLSVFTEVIPKSEFLKAYCTPLSSCAIIEIFNFKLRSIEAFVSFWSFRKGCDIKICNEIKMQVLRLLHRVDWLGVTNMRNCRAAIIGHLTWCNNPEGGLQILHFNKQHS